jgi:hypothetical protein
MTRRRGGFAVLLISATAASLGALADDTSTLPEPSCDRIAYEDPAHYATPVAEKIASKERVEKIAAGLKKEKAEDTFKAIGGWIDKNLRYDDKAAYAWRSFDKIVEDGTYGGCADHAVAFGTLARACGIPTVWVKTMDVDWIREFRAAPDTFEGSWRGHVFLEVHVRGKWMLLNATELVLHSDYDTKMRLFPGNRYAYDKGGDPYELLLSVRWEEWKKQTRAYFKKFDMSKLPVPGGDRLSSHKTLIAANRPVWQWLTDRCHDLGCEGVFSFNSEFEKYLAEARGHLLIVTCVGDTLVFPEKDVDSLLPTSREKLEKLVAEKAHGQLSRRLADGTNVVLLYARNEDEMRKAVEELTLDAANGAK